MGRFALGVGILLTLLCLCLGVSLMMRHNELPICRTLEEASQLALAGKTELALTLVQQAKTRWEELWHQTAAISEHNPMDEIDSLFAQLEAYGKGGYSVHTAALCMRLSQLIEAISDAQHLNWWNLL